MCSVLNTFEKSTVNLQKYKCWNANLNIGKNPTFVNQMSLTLGEQLHSLLSEISNLQLATASIKFNLDVTLSHYFIKSHYYETN